MLIIDNEVAYSGGINLSDRYINLEHPYGHWKDTGFRITGEPVKNFTHMFLTFWNAFSLEKEAGQLAMPTYPKRYPAPPHTFAVCPHLANQFSPVLGMLLNIAALAVLILFGCHNPSMFNQSTLVLGYLLLYGYDVTGKSYQMRLVGMALGAALTCFVFYRNHKNRTYKRNLNDLVQEFDISSSRTKWQICQILCVPIVLCIAELCNMPRAMWAGIAAMSAILPFMEDMHYRVRKRIVGNIAGVICFTVLYFLLPSSIYAYIGILGGIGVGFSAQYGWQAVFNTFGALAIAAETYGLQGAVSLRVSQNVFGVVFALAFCVIFYWFMPKKKESEVTVHAE